MNSGGQLGRYVWQVRGGTAPNMPARVTVVNRVLEGNAPDSYVGYTGTGDATATDPDGTIASLITNDRPALLPLGTTTVTVDRDRQPRCGHHRHAVDRRHRHDAADQPAAVESDARRPGSGPSDSTVTVNSAGATDVCTGVRAGSPTRGAENSSSTPDTLADPSIMTTVTTTTTTTVDSQTLPERRRGRPAWTRSNATYVRLTNAAGRNHGTYAAEIWDDNNNATRRTVNFYRDYDLPGFTSASLSFWDNVSAFSTEVDYARVEYSTERRGDLHPAREPDRPSARPGGRRATTRCRSAVPCASGSPAR